MTVLSSGECGGTPAPPPPPPPCAVTAPVASSPVPRHNNGIEGTAPDKNLLMADIRNGISLKPTKTKDKSTPAFIKKSSSANRCPSPPPAQLNGANGDNTSIVEMKDALQEELRNTLKRKVKKQDVERGDCTKKEEIEKAMENSRTEVQLKVNTSSSATPSLLNKDVLDASKSNGVQSSVATKVDKPSSVSNGVNVVLRESVKTSPFLVKKQALNTSPIKSNGVQSAPIKTQQLNGSSYKTAVPVDPIVKQTNHIPVTEPAPQKPPRVMQNVVDNSKPVSPVIISNGNEENKLHKPVKVEIKPFESSRTPFNGTLRKVSPQKALTIDVTISQDDRLKNTILSPDVKSGNAAIRPSQIKSLTQKGSHVSHTDILENPKPISKSPISLVESPKYLYTPPTPRSISPASSGQASPRTPTRTTILDTKISNTLLSPKPDPNAPQKKLMISHPKASFTLKRSTSNKAECVQATEPKPVFRILSNLEQSERIEADREIKTQPRQQAKKDAPKADEPGVEPVLTSYVSFSKELTNAPNNYPDVVTKHTTVGVVKQDLFLDSTNLRDIKIDIIEGGGQLKVVNK